LKGLADVRDCAAGVRDCVAEDQRLCCGGGAQVLEQVSESTPETRKILELLKLKPVVE